MNGNFVGQNSLLSNSQLTLIEGAEMAAIETTFCSRAPAIVEFAVEIGIVDDVVSRKVYFIDLKICDSKSSAVSIFRGCCVVETV